MSVDTTFAIDSQLRGSAIQDSRFASLRVKDAIADWFRDRTGSRPSVDLRHPGLRISLYLDGQTASLAIDLSGESLHRRGYRQSGGEAPLKENLAVAILIRCGWPEQAKDHGTLVDIMCGSGTLLVEGAMMALDIAPGLRRERFGFHGWAQHDEQGWQRLLEEARRRAEAGENRRLSVLGFDHDRRMVTHAQSNVELAGLSSRIHIHYQDVREFRQDVPARGLVVLNPPYGHRMGEREQLEGLYRAIGRTLKSRFQGWQASVFTQDQELAHRIGLRADRIHSLYNGRISCRLLHFTVDQEHRRSRLPGAPGAVLSDNARELQNRLVKNRKRLERWLRREGVTCYRLYDADLPNYAAAIDVYGSKELWLHVQEYRAPSSIPEETARSRLGELLSVSRQVMEVDEDHQILKRRQRQRGDDQYRKLGGSGHFLEVREGDCRLLVNLEDYLDTGLFLDQRVTRSLVAAAAAGGRFLNLFAYTGAATVHAALAGAKTTTVDLSNTYLDWTKRNLALNGMLNSRHELIRTDCRQWLREQARGGQGRYDVIFLDPPTFSNSTRMQGTLDIQRDHANLVELAAALLDPRGVLYFSTNARRFTLDESVALKYATRDITRQTTPPDFQGRTPHRCWEVRLPE